MYFYSRVQHFGQWFLFLKYLSKVNKVGFALTGVFVPLLTRLLTLQLNTK